MLKTILLATSVLVSAPAFAQDKPAADTTQSQTQTATPDQTAPATDPATASDPAATAQANPAPATQAAQPTPAQAGAQPAASQDQVAQAVNRDFGTYDKDANGTLSQAEFGTWIATLRKAAEPTFQPGSAEAQSYIGQAFAATDADKNKSVDKAELTTFLTPKPA